MPVMQHREARGMEAVTPPDTHGVYFFKAAIFSQSIEEESMSHILTLMSK